MANLENCQPVVPYTAEEFAGDTAYGVTGAALELQTPPANPVFTNANGTLVSAPWTSSATPGEFFLVIKSQPGYNIKAEYININGVEPIGNAMEAGVYNQYEWFYAGSTSAAFQNTPDVIQVVAVDSIPNDNSNCSNEVICKITLTSGFVMPAGNHFINIDFGGTALPCEVSVETTPPIFEYEIFNSNYSMTQGYGVWIAKWHPSLSALQNERWDSNAILQPNNSLNYNIYAPTPWAIYGNTFEENGGYETAVGAYGIDTLCGQLSAGHGPTSDTMGNPLNETGYSIGVPFGGFDNEGTGSSAASFGYPNNNRPGTFAFKYYINPPPNNIPFYNPIPVSQVDNPVLTPGNSILPTSLTWYFRVSDDWEIPDDPDFVKVWKIITISGAGGSPVSDSIVDTPFNALEQFCGSIQDNAASIEVSEKDSNGVVISNNSHLDISNVSITRPDANYPHVVRITIPFRTDLEYDVWELNSPAESPTTHRQYTKIFFDMYPVYVGQ
tara:strand:+ start:3841 stop:5334 length:1494 start_codon:yes stop_codon:yes gene_type:complete